MSYQSPKRNTKGLLTKTIFAIVLIVFVVVSISYIIKSMIEDGRVKDCIAILMEANKKKREAVLAEAFSSDLSIEKVAPETIAAILHEGHKSYGVSSETYLIDSRYINMANSRFEGYLSKGDKVELQSVALAFEGKTGSIVEIDPRGIRVVSIYSPLEYQDKKWAVLTLIDRTEAISSKFSKKFAGSMNKAIFRIEERWPTPQPNYQETHTVKEILTGNKILLSDGNTVVLIGVLTPAEDKESLSLMFGKGISKKLYQEYIFLSKTYLSRLVENEKVAYRVISKEKNGILFCYLWTIDFSSMNDPEINNFATEPSICLVNQGIVSSGWGISDSSRKHSLSKKFEKLEELARKEKVGLWNLTTLD